MTPLTAGNAPAGCGGAESRQREGGGGGCWPEARGGREDAPPFWSPASSLQAPGTRLCRNEEALRPSSPWGSRRREHYLPDLGDFPGPASGRGSRRGQGPLVESAPSPSGACRGPRTGRLPPCALVSPSGTNESGINSGPGSVSSWKEPGRWGHMGLDPFSAVGGVGCPDSGYVASGSLLWARAAA